MAYSLGQRRSALRLVAAQGYAVAAGLTGISESTLRRWVTAAAEVDHQRRSRRA
jgi:transposase-like protein